MNHLKTFGIAALAVFALMAVLGTSITSATVLCKNSSNTTTCSEDYASGTRIEATQTSGTTAVLETEGGTVLDTCALSTVVAKTSNTGGVVGPVIGLLEALTWGNCSRTTHTLVLGTLELRHSFGTDNGVLSANNGTEVTIGTIFGSCVYGSGSLALKLGTVKGGNPASLAISASVPKISGNFACPATALWTATYTVTSPKPLFVSDG